MMAQGLFMEDREGNQLAFVETLRDQHLSDREEYFEELEEAICSFDNQEDADGMVTMAHGEHDNSH